MHRASYDSNGDIILSDNTETGAVTNASVPVVVHFIDKPAAKKMSEPKKQHVPSALTSRPPLQRSREEGALELSKSELPSPDRWRRNEDEGRMKEKQKKHEPSITLRNIANKFTQGTSEGKSQFQLTISEARNELRAAKMGLKALPKRASGVLRRFWVSANSPVHLPLAGRFSKKPKTKLGLFIVDTIRFGGTFAGIFLVLFVAINYQSFLQIARAELALSGDMKTEQGLEQIVSGKKDNASEGGIANSISAIPETDMLAYLPQVGPYENRIIIPKLGENIPIVKPSMAALMNEDWEKFEMDIQTALKGGVVHYPGSAKPGQAGNFFITGHSSYYPWDDGKYKNVFARLHELDPGDTYSVYYGGDRHTYRVISKKEVKPSDVSVLDQPTDKRIATLMTCTPVGTTLRRLIVRSEEIDAVTGETLHVGEKASDNEPKPAVRLESLPI